jgi:hypothetical protein
LVDVSETAKMVGLIVPVAVTSAVWSSLVEPDKEGKEVGENVENRLRHILYRIYWTIKVKGGDNSIINYEATLILNGEVTKVELKAAMLPGDNFEPVITVMLPDED